MRALALLLLALASCGVFDAIGNGEVSLANLSCTHRIGAPAAWYGGNVRTSLGLTGQDWYRDPGDCGVEVCAHSDADARAAFEVLLGRPLGAELVVVMHGDNIVTTPGVHAWPVCLDASPDAGAPECGDVGALCGTPEAAPMYCCAGLYCGVASTCTKCAELNEPCADDLDCCGGYCTLNACEMPPGGPDAGPAPPSDPEEP